MSKCDITIIGSGPGGYVAALYAAGLGKRVVVIEKDKVGGVCLNCGCIPTKAIIASVNALRAARSAPVFGIEIGSYRADYSRIRSRKDEVVAALTKGIESLFKAKKIELKRGFGRIIDRGVVEVNGERIESQDIIIAAGTSPAELAGFKFDKLRVLSSADMLEIERLPGKLLIVGGGVNGCEYAYIYASLGVKVTVVEMMDRLLPAMDRELGKEMEILLKGLGVTIMTKTKLDKTSAEYDKTVICIGRKYNTEGLGLEKAGIKKEKNRISVDETLRTSAQNIYAVGDVKGGYLLAHVASHEGIVACDNIAGRARKMDYDAIPLCVYTDPEMASVGLTEEEARQKEITVKTAKFPFRGIGKPHITNEKEGFIKIVGEAESGETLGIQMLGSGAALLAGEAGVIVRNKMKIEDICGLIHAHPTLSEVFTEAAFVYNKTPLHSI